MKQHYKNSQVNNVLLIAIAFVIAIVMFKFVTFSPKIFLAFIAVGVFFLAFFKTDVALILVIFSMLLSPEIALGGVRGREVVVRMEDLLLFVVFFGWFAKMAVNKELGLLRITPLNFPILMFVGICVTSSLIGVLKGHVSFKESFFYNLKYIEYVLLFFMVTNHLRDIKQFRRFLFFLLLVTFIISLYAWYLHYTGMERVTAPFEGKKGEANTLGGYLTLLIMVAMGLFLYLEERKIRLLLLTVIFFALFSLLFTLSRGSWLGFGCAYLTLMTITKRGKGVLFIVLLLFIISSSVIFPEYIYKRVNYTFSGRTQRTVFGHTWGIDESTAARIDTWREAVQSWVKEPLLGYGVGAPGPIVDNQYARTLNEVGIVGFIAFLWIIFGIFKQAFYNLPLFEHDRLAKGFLVGFIAALVSLLIHSFSAASFILIRIMEPFWFLTAMMIVLPELSSSSQESTEVT